MNALTDDRRMANTQPTPNATPAPQRGPAAPPQDAAFLSAFRGRFMVFEGPDGSGKSTQFRRLLELCEAAKVPVSHVREPGGTVTGERIREVLLDRATTGMTVRCEMLLYMASRAELVEQRILPALSRGDLVLADRFVSSTLAYQGAAGGLPAADIAAVARVATRGLVPDLVLLFDIDQAAAARRLSPLLDRMEAKGAAFHERVRQGYLDLAKADPRRFAVIDARQGEQQVWSQLVATLRSRGPTLDPRRGT
ncbi:MAG: dTMP kinase [Phycisphaerales bacterium]